MTTQTEDWQMTKEFKVPPPSKSDLFYLHCYYHVYKNLERQQNRENPIPKEPNPSKQQNSIPKQNRGKTERPLSTKLKNITTWLFFSYYSTSTLSFIRVAPISSCSLHLTISCKIDTHRLFLSSLVSEHIILHKILHIHI